MAKLVEILARELKDWHNSWPALGQASDGSLHREPFLGGHTNFCLTLASDYSDAIVTRAEWQAAVDALKGKHSASEELVSDYVEAQSDRYTKAWDGVGLPPVGCACECLCGPTTIVGKDHLEPGEPEWVRTEILAHIEVDGVKALAVGQAEKTGTMGAASSHRPIRTPEQIAAEEREKFIDELIKVTCIRRGEAGLIYDAGYRKQEPK